MKTVFTKAEILSRRGCYDREKVEGLSFINQEVITIYDILKSEIPLKDKRWFVFSSCDLSREQKQRLALDLAWAVLPIFEEKYPEDKRARECLEATEKYLKGEISDDELVEKRMAAEAAYAAAAYAVAAYAAYAAAEAAAAYAAAAYAAAAAAAAADAAYKEKFVNCLIKFFQDNENR